MEIGTTGCQKVHFLFSTMEVNSADEILEAWLRANLAFANVCCGVTAAKGNSVRPMAGVGRERSFPALKFIPGERLLSGEKQPYWVGGMQGFCFGLLLFSRP